ncbi:MAG TPA: hypothetical protein PKZ38_08445 [Dermatophilaceae bacterium]|nr:hypothetical protein [Dermatophilaceae bacterium]
MGPENGAGPGPGPGWGAVPRQGLGHWAAILIGAVALGFALAAALFTSACAATLLAGTAAVVSDGGDVRRRATWSVAAFGGLLGIGLYVAGH